MATAALNARRNNRKELEPVSVIQILYDVVDSSKT